jgi:superfamily II DNA/RNA helicase
MTILIPWPPLSGHWARQVRCRHRTASWYVSNNFCAYFSSSHLHETKTPTFESVGVRPNVVTALHAAFPNVKHPTGMQAQLIKTVMSGDDILLKDQTGTGKCVPCFNRGGHFQSLFLFARSFGLILALLSKSRMRLVEGPDSKGHDRQGKSIITSILIVPHQELAKQLFHWIHRIATALGVVPSLSSICQLVIRDSRVPPSSQAACLRKEPPHILVATPNAALDVFNEDPDALQLRTLSTVVVDDVDYLIPTVPRNQKRSEYKTKIQKAKIDR